MEKKVLSLFVVCFLALMLPLAASAIEYKHTLDAKGVQFSWAFDDENIHVMISAETESWVAVGFDPEKAMQGANIIIGYVKNGKVKIEDDYGNRKTGHKSDTKLGGTDDVINPSGREEKGMTILEFSFPLKSADQWDKPIDPFGTTRVILAHGKGRDSLSSVHPWRAVYDVNLSTGENKKIK